MAVTNRAKGQEKPPSWAQKGKLRLAQVLAGPAETARLILMDRWDGLPATLLPLQRYGPKLVDELILRKFNAVCLAWSCGFSHVADQAQWDCVKAILPLLKKKKIRTVAAIWFTSAFADELIKQNPEAKNWPRRDDKGAPVKIDGSPRLVEMDLSHAGWRNYIAEKIRFALESGFDGIYFPDSLAAEPSAVSSFLEALPKLIGSSLSPNIVAQASSLQEISPPNRGVDTPPEAREILFCCNSTGHLPLSAAGNFHCGEPLFEAGLPGEKPFNNLEYYKRLFEAGGRERPFACHFEAGSNAKKDCLATAEILATGGICTQFDAPLAYQLFQAEHIALFASADPVSSIGIFYDDYSGEFPTGVTFPMLLARNNIQYDLIPASRFQHFDLGKYKLLGALNLCRVSNPLLEALRAFVRQHGGTLLLSGSTGTLDPLTGESSQSRSPFSLFEMPPLLQEGRRKEDGPPMQAPRTELPEGLGRVIAYGGCEPVYNENETAFLEGPKQMYLDDVKKYGGESLIEIQAPEGIVALLWGKGTRRWVHVLNYRAEVTDAEIILPGCGGRTLFVHSPDGKPPLLTVLETGSARAIFSLTGIETYAIVEVV